MIKINIVKLPPESQALAREIEDTLTQMVSKTVKSMVGVDNKLENLEITMYEALEKIIVEQRLATVKASINPEPSDRAVPVEYYDFDEYHITGKFSVTAKEALEQMGDCVNLYVQFSDASKFAKNHPECAEVIRYFRSLRDGDPKKAAFKKTLKTAKIKEKERRELPVG